MQINIFKFLLIVFIVGFVSDLILMYLSLELQINKTIASLQPYFNNYGWKSPFYAGITCVIASILCLAVYMLITQQYSIDIDINIMYIIVLGFIIGFMSDYLINIFKIFGNNLNSYYNVTGDILSAIYGALALVICIIAAILSKKILHF